MYLYKFDSIDAKNISMNSCDGIDLKVFTPSPWAFLIKGEKVTIKTVCVRLLFLVMTLGKAQIYYVKNGKDIVHTSYVVPACAKFSFMNRKDLEIGPCYTYPAFRGKGIYPRVLSEICRRKSNDALSIYMIVDEANLPSIKGIEKAGFVRCGSVFRSKFTKCYKLVQ